MTKIRALYDHLNQLADFNMAASWDNCGFMVGSLEEETSRCILALDVTMETIALAEKVKANLIITHHPMIFRPLSSIPSEDRVSLCIKKGITVISAHTNLDIAEKGVNWVLSNRLCLNSCKEFQNKDQVGLIGTLPARMEADELAFYIKDHLHAPHVEYTKGSKKIHTLAIVGGSGGAYLPDAIQSGADALLTGEVRHNEMIDAINAEYTLISAGHYFTEAPILGVLQNYFKKSFPAVRFLVDDHFAVWHC